MVNQEATPKTRPQYRSWSFWAGLVVSLGCLLWAVSALDWAAVANALASANAFWTGLSVLLVLLTIVVRLARWTTLLHPRRTRRSNLLTAMLIGQLLNYFAPARAGDLARAYLLGQAEDASKAWVLGTIALEKLWDLWALLLSIGLLLFLSGLPDWLVPPARGLALVSFLVVALSWLLLANRPRVRVIMLWLGRYLPPRFGTRLGGFAGLLLDGLDGLRRPRVWFWAAIYSAVLWFLGTLINYTVLLALGQSLPFSAPLLLMIVLQMGVAVPSAPGSVGVFEGLCIVILALFSVNRDTAFAVGLLLHVVTFVPPILLGLYALWRTTK